MATKILLIEDEPILISLYAMMLNRAGYEVETAMNAESGEEKLVISRPHLILLDLLIPQNATHSLHGESMHEPMGFQILRMVKGTPSMNDIRVIVLSNLDSDEHVAMAKKLGADEYLVKANLDPHDLQGHVERILRGGNGWGGA